MSVGNQIKLCDDLTDSLLVSLFLLFSQNGKKTRDYLMSISATRGPDRRKITNVVLGGNENPALFFALFSARKANYLEGYFPLSPSQW